MKTWRNWSSDEDIPTEPKAPKKEKSNWTRRNVFSPINGVWIKRSEEEVEEVLFPIEYFQKYITEELFETIVEKTNIYGLQSGEVFQQKNLDEIKIFFGIHVFMGTFGLPRICLYWNTILGIDIFHNSMTLNRFFKLQNCLHLVNNLDDQSATDRLWKVCPIYNSIRKRCLEIPIEEKLCR